MPDKKLTTEQRQQNKEAVRHIKEWMKKKNATQEKVAEALGVTQVMISKWLNGYIALTVRDLLSIEKYLQLNTGDLLLNPSQVEEKERHKQIISIAEKMNKDAFSAWLEMGKQASNK